MDGKSHYGDGLYAEAARVLELDDNYLRQSKSMAERFALLDRSNNLSWRHHYEVASLKTLAEKKGKLVRTDEHDMDAFPESDW